MPDNEKLYKGLRLLDEWKQSHADRDLERMPTNEFAFHSAVSVLLHAVRRSVELDTPTPLLAVAEAGGSAILNVVNKIHSHRWN